jgi:hypothetical protein
MNCDVYNYNENKILKLEKMFNGLTLICEITFAQSFINKADCSVSQFIRILYNYNNNNS